MVRPSNSILAAAAASKPNYFNILASFAVIATSFDFKAPRLSLYT